MLAAHLVPLLSTVFSPSTPCPPLFTLQGTYLDLWLISRTTIKNNYLQKAHSIFCRKSQFQIKYNCHLVPFAVVPFLSTQSSAPQMLPTWAAPSLGLPMLLPC